MKKTEEREERKSKKKPQLMNIEEGIDRYERLCCHPETYNCVLQHYCIPCVYKLFPNIRALIDAPPNQRPEMCRRAQARNEIPLSPSSFFKRTNLGLYTSGDSILTVGDGDFTFSLSLVRHLQAINLVATSFESLSSLRETYKGISSTLHELSSSCKEVLHGVDGRNIPDHQMFNKASIYRHYFDYIVWNFPCVGIPAGQDGQAGEIEENKTMLTKFFQTCGSLIKHDRKSEVHITHKTLEPFSWWNIIEIAKSSGWHHRRSVVFDKYLYPGYTNRKALDQKSFPCNDALIYVFCQTEEEKEMELDKMPYPIVVLDSPRKNDILSNLEHKFSLTSSKGDIRIHGDNRDTRDNYRCKQKRERNDRGSRTVRCEQQKKIRRL